MRVFFIDTNVFLHCHELRKLAWADTGVEDLLLLIPRNALKEIDNYILSGTKVMLGKAGKAHSLIRNILATKNSQLVIQEASPRVEISFAPEIPQQQESVLPASLDISRSEDCIIAEMIAYKNKHVDQNISILTHGTHTTLLARSFGFSYFLIPDTWLMFPKPDARDKRIALLEREIKTLKKDEAKIDVVMLDKDRNKCKEISVVCYQYKSLNNRELSELLALVRKIYPMETHSCIAEIEMPGKSFGHVMHPLHAHHSPASHVLIPPGEDAVEHYKTQEYPAWLERVRKYLQLFPREMEAERWCYPLYVEIANTGIVSAKHTVVEFEASGNIFFRKNEYAGPYGNSGNKKRVLLPRPPKAPEWSWEKMNSIRLPGSGNFSFFAGELNLFSNESELHTEVKQENKEYYTNVFLTKYAGDNTKHWKFACDTFRHGNVPERFHVGITIPFLEKDKSLKTVKCTVSAKNLSKTISNIIHVNVSYRTISPFKEIRKRILDVMQ